MVLRLLNNTFVALNLYKCALLTNRIDYLRRIIRFGGRDVADHTADEIRKLETPTTVTALRSL